MCLERENEVSEAHNNLLDSEANNRGLRINEAKTKHMELQRSVTKNQKYLISWQLYILLRKTLAAMK